MFVHGCCSDLSNSHGRTFSDSSSRLWNVERAVRTDTGFQVLLTGEGKRAGRYMVWSTNDSGVITESSGWKRDNQMLALGYEAIFNYDFNGDGAITIKIVIKNCLIAKRQHLIVSFPARAFRNYTRIISAPYHVSPCSLSFPRK